ncbi:luciferin 4-monooxygenase-like [Epargyreus clarus]|uniref:luciferin 4-monooxygenase-like n=1 Tax=Epargyreus clarus TaxID=520877 RepID=UPI003C2D2B7E
MLRNNNYIYGSNDVMVPGHLNFGHFMMDKCKQFKEIIALQNADTGETMTYKQFLQLSVDIALSLRRMGVKKGDVISICSDKRLEFMPTLLGIMCTGATLFAATVSCRNERIQRKLELTKPKIIFCSPTAYDIHKDVLKTTGCEKLIIYGDESNGELLFKDFLTQHGSVEDFLPVAVEGWRDIAVILFSSGTTGLPKPTPLTHLNLISINQTGVFDHISCGKRILVTREWYYSYGILHTVGALVAGATVVFSVKSGLEDYLEIIQKQKVSMLQLVPATLNEIIKSSIVNKYNLSSVEKIILTSTPIDGNMVAMARTNLQNLRKVVQMYGMSEAGCLIINDSGMGHKINSAGTVRAGTIFKVVDIETREPLGPNQRGEICFKSITLMPGYLGDTIFEYIDEEGFYKSGDVGYYDEDEYFYIVDRIKDMIKYCGASFSPAELESALMLHPAVKEVGIGAKPDEKYDQIPIAFVVLKTECNVNETEIMQYFEECMPTIKLGGVRFVSSLPRGAGDKLDRKALKDMLKAVDIFPLK